jgi:hypothetical protein
MRDRTGVFGGTAADIRDNYRGNIHRLLRAVYGLDVPVIAAVNGPRSGSAATSRAWRTSASPRIVRATASVS